MAYYASFMPPGMREEQTEVWIWDFSIPKQLSLTSVRDLVGEEQQLRYQVRKIRLESAPDKGMV